MCRHQLLAVHVWSLFEHFNEGNSETESTCFMGFTSSNWWYCVDMCLKSIGKSTRCTWTDWGHLVPFSTCSRRGPEVFHFMNHVACILSFKFFLMGHGPQSIHYYSLRHLHLAAIGWRCGLHQWNGPVGFRCQGRGSVGNKELMPWERQDSNFPSWKWSYIEYALHSSISIYLPDLPAFFPIAWHQLQRQTCPRSTVNGFVAPYVMSVDRWSLYDILDR